MMAAGGRSATAFPILCESLVRRGGKAGSRRSIAAREFAGCWVTDDAQHAQTDQLIGHLLATGVALLQTDCKLEGRSRPGTLTSMCCHGSTSR